MNCNDCGGFLPRECTCSAFGGRADRGMFTPDPMNLPLPCDITVGGGTFRKGVKLITFVEAARRWHREAFPDFYTLTDEQKAANLAALQGNGGVLGTPAPHVLKKDADE